LPNLLALAVSRAQLRTVSLRIRHSGAGYRRWTLTLTPAGVVFLDAVTNVLEMLHGTREQLQGSLPALNNNIKIATCRTLASTFFPEWYEDVVHRFGFFTATLTTCSAEEAILRLMAGEVDLLIVYSSMHTRLLIDHGHLDFLMIARDNLIPVSTLDSRGSARYKLPGGAEPLPWPAFARALTLRTVLARHLADLPAPPLLKPVYQADSYESILAMAKRGIGLAWLPQRLVQNDVVRGELAIAGNASWRVGFDIALYRQRNRAHPILDNLWSGLAANQCADAPNPDRK
jgi:LysR family transcriptional regulator, hypochlorite-specific transcription factor HypT